VCTGQEPGSVTEALAAVRAGLAFLNRAPAADLPGPVLAGCLRELAAAEAAHTAAHARLLAAFAASGGHEDDGQQSARAWLTWQTKVTSGAAAGAVGWARRLAAYPALGQVLAGGTLSPSWARHMAAWADAPPQTHRDAAVDILVAAAGPAE
jgi:Domain of unknown function (DUF222)